MSHKEVENKPVHENGLQATSQFIISSACLWFINSDGKLIHFYVLESFQRSIIYNFGSLVLGALLLTIIQFIRFWLEYINYQMKQFQGEPQQLYKMFKMLCFSKDLFSLSIQNAFIQIALLGKNLPAPYVNYLQIY